MHCKRICDQFGLFKVKFFLYDCLPCRAGVSNTRPAGHMRPARGSNAAREHQKKWRFDRKNWVIFLIFPNKLNFSTQFKNFIFMQPARSFFESHAALESLWVWDPWCREWSRRNRTPIFYWKIYFSSKMNTALGMQLNSVIKKQIEYLHLGLVWTGFRYNWCSL